MKESLLAGRSSALDAHKPYPSSLFGCYDYKEPDTQNRLFCPYFLPMSLLGTCCIVGRIESKIGNENPVCCEMGPKGLFCCLISLPVNMIAPLGNSKLFKFNSRHLLLPKIILLLGGACWFSSLAFSYRETMQSKYGYLDDGKCCTCFGPLNPYCECTHNACNYPCSFFQIYVALREEENRNKK